MPAPRTLLQGTSPLPRPASGARQDDRLFAIFLASRTTLEDLSRRTSALGESVAASVIAAYLTGRCSVSAAAHNAVAEAINLRLRELSRPAAAPYRRT